MNELTSQSSRPKFHHIIKHRGFRTVASCSCQLRSVNTIVRRKTKEGDVHVVVAEGFKVVARGPRVVILLEEW